MNKAKKEETKITLYPKNKSHYIKLIRFLKKLLSELHKHDIEPVLYGSLACFFHSKDKDLKVNDIDFYVSEKSLPKIGRILKKLRISHKYSKKWHVLEAYSNNLKIDFDSMDFWSKNIPKNYVYFEFSGLKVKSLDLKTLTKIYKKAYDEAHSKKEHYLYKLNLLKKIK